MMALLQDHEIACHTVFIFAQERKDVLFNIMQDMMDDLIDSRRQLIAKTLTQDQTKSLKQRMTTKIDCGNK